MNLMVNFIIVLLSIFFNGLLACNPTRKGVLSPTLFATKTTTTLSSTTSESSTASATQQAFLQKENYGIIMLPPHGRLQAIQDTLCFMHGSWTMDELIV